MAENFDLEIEYKGSTLTFPAEYLPIGYTFRIRVEIDGMNVFFERDDEKQYRAIVSPEYLENSKAPDKELLRAIAVTLQQSL